MINRFLRWTPVLAAGLLAAGCVYPEYFDYTSPAKDFQCSVPSGWSVKVDRDGDHFLNVTFIGGFDPDFYLGAPTISVRWYSTNKLHTLPDKMLEIYTDHLDYIRQTLRLVYGAQENTYYYLIKGTPKVVRLSGSGVEAIDFTVVSPARVDDGRIWGTKVQKGSGGKFIRRKHRYVVLPMEGGFYSLIYPATMEGYDRCEKVFMRLVNSFKPLKHGPAGPAVAPAPGAK